MKSSLELSVEEYGEKVYYCKRCHSLCILVDESLAGPDWDGAYCGKCRSTDIGECMFGDWLAEEEKRQRRREQIEWNK